MGVSGHTDVDPKGLQNETDLSKDVKISTTDLKKIETTSKERNQVRRPQVKKLPKKA